MRIAYGGHPGAFGELACLGRFPDDEPIGFDTFRMACDALLSGDCDRAVIPFENSIAGAVPGVEVLIASLPVARIDVYPQPVVFHCLAVPGARLDQIEVVSSHPMALAECRRFLARVGAKAQEAGDTAGAASEVAQAGLVTRAALASTRAAQLYGLEVLEADVQDTEDNVTRFAVLRRA